METHISITESGGSVQFAVRVTPRAGRSAIAGVRDGALLVRLAAPPVEGAANEALIAFLADLFERPKRDVQIVGGGTSRHKRTRIAGARAGDVLATLARLRLGSGSGSPSPDRID